MTAALEGGEWSAARPGRTLSPGKTRYSLYRRLGGPQGWSGRAENLVPTRIRSRSVQHVASRYTDRATRPTSYIYIFVESQSLTNCRKVIRLDLLHCCETSRYPCQSDHPPSPFHHTSTGAVEEETTATTTSKIEFSSPTLVSGLHKIAGSPQRASPSPSVQSRVNKQKCSIRRSTTNTC